MLSVGSPLSGGGVARLVIGSMFNSMKLTPNKHKLCTSHRRGLTPDFHRRDVIAGITNRFTKRRVGRPRGASGLAATVSARPYGIGKTSLPAQLQNPCNFPWNLPLIIEIVDAEDKINSFLPCLDKMIDAAVTVGKK